MKIRNNSAKGKMVHYKINGVPMKQWVGSYDILSLPEVTHKSQLNLSALEEAIIHEESHKGTTSLKTPETFSYVISASVSATGGTTSLSGSSVSVLEGANLSFTAYPQANYYLSTYTVNGASATISTPSATTVYALSNVNEDKNIYMGFTAFGA